MKPFLIDRRLPAWVWLLLIVSVGVGLRVVGLGSHSLWFDEVVTMRLARQPNPSALKTLIERIDATRAPLHPLLLQAWLTIFGESDLAGRALSALCGSGAILLVYWVGRQAFDQPTALWGAWLFAICPIEVEYAQEVRMYAWLVLLTCLCWGLLLSLRDSAPRWKRAAYAFGLVALLYTHPLGGLMIVALALGYLTQAGESRLSFRDWVLIHVAVVLAFAPWVIRYLDHPPDPKHPRHFQAYNWPKAFLGGTDWAVAVGAALAVAGALVIHRPAGTNGRKHGRERLKLRDWRATLAFLSWFLIPPLLIHLYSTFRHPISGPIRYVLYVGPAYLLLVGRGLARLPWLARMAATTIILALAIPAFRDRVYDPNAKPDWRAAAATIEQVAPGSIVVVFCKDEHFYLPTLQYYLPRSTRMTALNQFITHQTAQPEPTVWYVGDQIDGIQAVPELLSQLYEPVEVYRYGRLTLTYNRLRIFSSRISIVGASTPRSFLPRDGKMFGG